MTLGNVLISSAGRRVSLLRAFQLELSRLARGGLVFGSDVNPGMSAACQVADAAFTVPRIDHPDYADHLLELCREHEIGLVIPTIDPELELFAEQRTRFKEHGVALAISDRSFVRICRDKRLTGEFFLRNGIAHPKPITKKAPTFPLFIKPYDGSLSRDIFVIRQARELTEDHLNNDKLLFMEYIDPREHDEFTVDMFYSNSGELLCAVPRKRIVVRGGEIAKGRTQKGPLLECLRVRLRQIDGARGCLTAQFFVHRETGRVIGIEINPRFGGGFPLSYRAGANYPRWLIGECLGHPPRSYWDGWEDRLLMLRYDDEVFVHAAAY